MPKTCRLKMDPRFRGDDKLQKLSLRNSLKMEIATGYPSFLRKMGE